MKMILKQLILSAKALSVLVLLLVAAPAFAQINHTSEEQHEKEQESALKEANKTEAAYKKTHLNTSVYTFGKGESPRRQVKTRDNRHKLKFDKNGDPVKPKKKFWKRKHTQKQTI